MKELDILLRMLAAMAAGALIGLERSHRERPPDFAHTRRLRWGRLARGPAYSTPTKAWHKETVRTFVERQGFTIDEMSNHLDADARCRATSS